ncbi:MAG: CPXCG motif-containing cysteine-rich protein [Arenicellales bacterium WSBS_2016_MAG_OTU3]
MVENDSVICPYCGERFDVLVDTSAGDQNYVEDCWVCCRPIEFSLTTETEDAYRLSVRTNDE